MTDTKDIWIKFGYDNAIEEVKKAIDEINLELFLTDIKDKQGNKIELSDEIMQLIQIWWEQEEQQLLKKLGLGEGK